MTSQPPSSPDAFTKDILAEILQDEYGGSFNISSFQTRDAEAGVLSQVVFVDVEYASGEEEKKEDISPPPAKFVAKFLLPQFPLEHMFRVESHFYRTTEHEFPFRLPRPVYTSSSMIIVEHVASDRHWTAAEGCPQEMVLPIITQLGRFHAQSIETPELWEGLASPAGVGSTLSGLAKETQFAGQWEDFLANIPSLSESVRTQVASICTELSNRRLRDIHDKIHDHPLQTLIHGDFHVANMLFQKEDIWLVDWATCGKGFPLIDLAFFAIVSLSEDVREQVEDGMLQAYHKGLGPAVDMSFEDRRRMYRTCLLNQFLILVGYDRMSRQLVHQAKRPEELAHHFNVVNARACHALVDNFGEDLLPRIKTKEELELMPTGDVTL